MREKTRARSTLVGRAQGKKSLGRHRCKLEDNIKQDPKEIGWQGVD